ncbi:PAS domain S-box-containing protein [Hymenobacter mucosus]|uniref:histidine kinase n=2 Tax=Hymenobacter mucosus TaxID=1411120 RepID=A0A238V8L0_9BACT|nr:PAS domain S-box-containing protein [Hymenobacter mucosus]
MIGKTNEESCQHRQRPAAIAQQRRRAFREVLSGKSEMTWEETIEKGQEQRFFLRRLSSAVGPDGSSQLLISSGIDITERKRTEQQMAQQQQFYEAILNLLPVDIAVFDAEHRFLFVNPSSISDPSIRQQVIGKTNYEYMAARRRPMSLADQRQEHFESAVRTKTDVSWEETLTGPKGVKHILRNFRPIFDASGALQLVVGSGIDITARYAAEEGQRQVERQLREQQTFVRLIVDALPDVVYVKDANGQVVFRNAAFDALASRSKQHWQPTEEQSIAVQEELWQIRVLNKQVMATSRPLKTEMSLTMSRGEPCHLQVYMCPMASADGSPGILTVSTDITNLKLARLALEQREKQYHDLVRYSQALICTHDLEGTLLTVNPAIERLVNLPAARLIGRNIREAIPPEHQSAVADYLASTNQPTTEPRLMTIMTSTGERRYLHYYTYQVREADAAPYVVASGYDVTQGIRAERALLQAKQEAEANAHAKESFLSRMSHEIRTPLNGVLGMAVLLEKTTLTPQQQEYLTTMQQAGQHLLALVNDVLDMAKITTHHLQIDQAEFDLVMALQSAGQTVAALATQKGLTLLVEPPTAAMPRVLGDAYRLHQVLLNLLSNALKFTTQGSVQLGASVLVDVAESLTVRFWVQDTGIGIEPEHQERIFDAFTQASAATSYRFGGTGLGLAISEQLVHHMGGSLLLCSTPGEGTTFSFTLTLPRVHATTEAAVPVPINYEGLEGLRVLLAEDNVVNQWITTVLLEQRGVLVYAVGTGTEALAQLETKSYDAALLDIQMPGLSGVDVTRAVRQHPDAARASVPLIALTANAFDADQEAYLAAGMNACLTKPFEEDDLYRLLLQVTATATSQ